MIPFIKDKNRGFGGTTVEVRKPDMPDNSQDSEQDQGLEECARQFMRALETKDAKLLAQAFKDAFEICDAGSSDEYPDEQDTE